MIKLVVFDMAGTTVDEDNVVYKTVREAINSKGYSFSQDEVQAVGAGKEKSQAIRDVLALDGQTHSEDEVQEIFRDFKSSGSLLSNAGCYRTALHNRYVQSASRSRHQGGSEYRLRPENGRKLGQQNWVGIRQGF